MDKRAMLKEAAQVLREQQNELDHLHEKIACAEKAEKIVRTLIDNNDILLEDVFQKISELRTKKMMELEIMEKAAEFGRSSFSIGLGSLSNQSEYNSNPLLDYLLSEN